MTIDAASAHSKSNRDGLSSSERRHHPALKDEAHVPKSMAEALESEDPLASLRLLSDQARSSAAAQSEELREDVISYQLKLPSVLLSLSDDESHPVSSAVAGSDSIRQSLSKIASGGSQASQEIQVLEQSKCDLEEHAQAVQWALTLRLSSDKALQAMQTNQWKQAAEAVRPWLEWKEQDAQNGSKGSVTSMCRAYAGEYCLKQLATSHKHLKETLLQQYESAVLSNNLEQLGQLTPILSLVQLEPDAVRFYLQYLKTVLLQGMQAPPQASSNPQKPTPPFAPMARVYNAAVSCIRHHLPMVSHFLYKADGDVAVVQLVHVQVEQAVLPLLEQYQTKRQLSAVYTRAQQIYAALEERYTGRGMVDEAGGDENGDDCGFAANIGSLSDADAAMEEAARCIQSTESYLRFIHHTCDQVHQARRIRFEQAQREKETPEWQQSEKDSGEGQTTAREEYQATIILPEVTPLHLTVAEIGGQYAGIERCLMLASMQRAFVTSNLEPRYFRPLSLSADSSNSNTSTGSGSNGQRSTALQTSMVEACLYAARHGAQRAFATGHTGTASAMTNFVSDCLTGILMEVLSQRAEDLGVAKLKPGEGLLVGSAGLFNNASNLIRQGHGSADDAARRQTNISRSCAMLNDVEVAVDHVQILARTLTDAVQQGYPADAHETEQLRLCVQSLSHVTDSFRVASNGTVESLESVLKPRLRSIVGEAIGSESSSSTFMGATDRRGANHRRLNYNLDEDSYNLLQLAEGYVERLCHALDELLGPLRRYLASRLWDSLLLQAMGTVCKRLEAALRKCEFTALGALTLDADLRDLVSFIKERLFASDLSSNTLAVAKACPALSRLLQMAKLLSVDDLDDVLDLISSAKRKGQWDLKLEDAKLLLSARVEFASSKVNELLRLPDEE